MADISKITIPNGDSTATYNLKDASALRTVAEGVISKIEQGNTQHLIAPTIYGSCSSSASSTTKLVTITDAQTITLEHGLTIFVRFDYTNSANSPYLNVQGSGAKKIVRRSDFAVPSYDPDVIVSQPDEEEEIYFIDIGTTPETSWMTGELVGFTYDTAIDSNGVWVIHRGKTYSATSTTITPVTLSKTNLGSTALTSQGTVTLQLGTVSNNVGTNSTTTTTNYKLSLSSVVTDVTSVNSLPIGGISGLTSNGQTVVTGIIAS